MGQLKTRRCRSATASKLQRWIWQHVQAQLLLQHKPSSPLQALGFPTHSLKLPQGHQQATPVPMGSMCHWTPPTRSRLSAEPNQPCRAPATPLHSFKVSGFSNKLYGVFLGWRLFALQKKFREWLWNLSKVSKSLWVIPDFQCCFRSTLDSSTSSGKMTFLTHCSATEITELKLTKI